MKAFAALLIFVFGLGQASAESNGFVFNLGADTEYLGLSSSLETDVSGDLAASQTSMNFVGGHLFADISRYFTTSAGLWYGLLDANGTADLGATHFKDTSANSLLLLEVATTFKYPIVVGNHFSLAPKVGLSAMYYLAGNYGGSAPSTSLKNLVSPFSVVVGADADYTFPNGVFLRLPVETAIALNSRPASITGSYIASSTITFRTGIAVGYKLLGFDRATEAEPAPAKTLVPAEAETSEPKPVEPAPPSKPLGLAVGGGTSFLVYLADQTTNSGVDIDLKQTLGQGGIYGFFDISDYVTVYGGFLFGIGDVTITVASLPADGAPNQLISWEAGAEVKYPFPIADKFTVAPKLGFAAVGYLSGTIGGSKPNTAGKQLYSPMLITAGADGNWALTDQMFVRVPVEIGYALNTKLPSSYYGGATYKSSYTISFRTGASVGYKF